MANVHLQGIVEVLRGTGQPGGISPVFRESRVSPMGYSVSALHPLLSQRR